MEKTWAKSHGNLRKACTILNFDENLLISWTHLAFYWLKIRLIELEVWTNEVVQEKGPLRRKQPRKHRWRRALECSCDKGGEYKVIA